MRRWRKTLTCLITKVYKFVLKTNVKAVIIFWTYCIIIYLVCKLPLYRFEWKIIAQNVCILFGSSRHSMMRKGDHFIVNNFGNIFVSLIRMFFVCAVLILFGSNVYLFRNFFFFLLFFRFLPYWFVRCYRWWSTFMQILLGNFIWCLYTLSVPCLLPNGRSYISLWISLDVLYVYFKMR